MTEEEYGRLADSYSPPSPIVKNCVNAFLVGGIICTLGQGLLNLYESMGMENSEACAAVSISLVALSVLLTGLSVYDDIAKFAGAGTLVPITGFANSVAAPAIEFRTEGLVLGVSAKIFTIAGPVLVHGMVASAVYGIIYWIYTVL